MMGPPTSPVKAPSSSQNRSWAPVPAPAGARMRPASPRTGKAGRTKSSMLPSCTAGWAAAMSATERHQDRVRSYPKYILRLTPMTARRREPPWEVTGPPSDAVPATTEGVLAGSDTLVVLNQGDLFGGGGALVEGVGEPFLGEAAGEFQAHDALPEGEYLGVVAQHRTLHGEGVVGGDGADAGDLVRCDGDAEACAADQQCAGGLARGDQLGGGDGHRRVRGVAGGVHSDVGHGLDEFVGFQVCLQGFFVLKSGVIAADDKAQFGAHAFSLMRMLWMARTISAMETAPASGVPRLF